MNFLNISVLAFAVFFNNVLFGEAGCASCTENCQCNTAVNLLSDDIVTESVGDYFPFLEFKEYEGRLLGSSDVDSYGCDELDYELMFVGAGQHFALAALSECDGTDKICKCPSSLVFHQASSAEENVNMIGVKKEVLEVSEDKLAKHDSLSVGTFTLGEIVESFDQAKSDEKFYDFESYNCGSLLIEMALKLGIDLTDKSIATYAANQLFDNASSYMMDGLSETDFRSATELKDYQHSIIEDFVNFYIAERV
jgi:hypothetical protein